MSTEPTDFDDALRLEGVVLDEFKRADLWRRLSEMFVARYEHDGQLEEAGWAAAEDEAKLVTSELNQGFNEALDNIVQALEPLAGLSRRSLDGATAAKPLVRADRIATYIARLGDDYTASMETGT